MRVCNCSMFCCTLLYVHSNIAIIFMGKRELVDLLNLSSWCLVMFEWLFLVVHWGFLWLTDRVFCANQTSMFLIHIITKGEVGAVKLVSALRYNSITDHSKAVLLFWIFCLIYVLCFSCFRICSLLPCEFASGERADHLVFVCDVYSRFCHFPMWYPESCVVLDCIDSWSLQTFLLYRVYKCAFSRYWLYMKTV